MKIECSLDRIKSITPEAVRNLLEKGEITLLDVRETEEYMQGHIKGAIHIPLSQQNQKYGHFIIYLPMKNEDI